MATRAQISPQEYLATSYPDLDREYVRGEVIERSMPTYDHGEVQAQMVVCFAPVRKTHSLFACTEVRMGLDEDLYRIPDVAVFAGRKPSEQVPREPPLVAIEILSPDDRWADLMDKLAEFDSWGVPNIWMVDPRRRVLMTYRNGVVAPVEVFTLPGYPIAIRYSDLE